MPTVSWSSEVRLWCACALLLLQGILEVLYRTGPLPWPNIFETHRAIYIFYTHFLISSCIRAHARLRLLASTVADSTWPFTPDLLESTHVVYLIWCPFRQLFYIGKTVDFMVRLRRHIYGFLAPESAHPQPYMSVLCAQARGDAAHALSSIVFMPIARCFEEEATLVLERSLIDSMHPPLNEPYVRSLLHTGTARRAPRPHHASRVSVTLAAATKPARLTQTALSAAWRLPQVKNAPCQQYRSYGCSCMQHTRQASVRSCADGAVQDISLRVVCSSSPHPANGYRAPKIGGHSLYGSRAPFPQMAAALYADYGIITLDTFIIGPVATPPDLISTCGFST